MLSRFHRIPERDGRTDGQNCYIKTETNALYTCGTLYLFVYMSWT